MQENKRCKRKELEKMREERSEERDTDMMFGGRARNFVDH